MMSLVFVVLTPSAHNDRSPRYMEKALAAIHQGLSPGESITLGYGQWRDEVALWLRFPKTLEERVVGPILANYPHSSITPIADEDDPRQLATDRRQWRAELTLTPELFPILRHGQFEDLLARRYADPLDGVLRALRPESDVVCWAELRITRATSRRVRAAKRAVNLLSRSFFHERPRQADYFADSALRPGLRLPARYLAWRAKHSPERDRSAPLDVSAGRNHEREADLQAAADKLGGHPFDVRLLLCSDVAEGAESLGKDRLHALSAAFGTFTRSRLATFHSSSMHQQTKSGHRDFLLSHEELATLWHPPVSGGGGERLHAASFTEHEPPAQLPAESEPGGVILGRVQFRRDDRVVVLRGDDRRRHQYVIGKTGMGKTTLLLNQIAGDVRAGHGLCLVDPHGDLCEAVLKQIPSERTNDVIVFDAADRDYAVGFNPLACSDASRIDQVTGAAVAAIKKMWDTSWGPRLEDTLRNALFVIVEQGGTLFDLTRLLGEAAYRERTVSRIVDPIVRAFWINEFAGWSKAYRTEAVAAIQNKIRPFLTNPTIRAIVAQRERSLNLRSVMDEGKVLLVNLSKGRIGEDNASLLGALLVAALQQAAMSRADVPEESRRDFYLSIDEFQNFTTGSFATILSEARKYRLNLTLSHQFLRQLDQATADAVAGNVGTIVSFAVGADDAEWLARAMSKSEGQLPPHDLTNLPKYLACLRLLVDGMPSNPFTIATLPAPVPAQNRSTVIVDRSRRQYARPVSQVHFEIEEALRAR